MLANGLTSNLLLYRIISYQTFLFHCPLQLRTALVWEPAGPAGGREGQCYGNGHPGGPVPCPCCFEALAAGIKKLKEVESVSP